MLKMHKMGVVRGQSRSSAVSSFDGACMISYLSLIETMGLSCRLVPFSRYGELFVKIRQLRPTPLAFGAPVGGDSVRISKTVWRQKNRVPGLSCGVVCVFLCLAILVEHRLVTDTDRHTAMAYTARA